jgi:hypothetical protein
MTISFVNPICILVSGRVWTPPLRLAGPSASYLSNRLNP